MSVVTKKGQRPMRYPSNRSGSPVGRKALRSNMLSSMSKGRKAKVVFKGKRK